METLVVIPARFGSSRFPGKPLAKLWGKPLIQLAYEAATHCPSVDRIIVATDNKAIMQSVRDFKGEVMLTEPSLRSGTDRVAEVASRVSADIIVNIQGDEILTDPMLIEDLIKPFLTAKVPIGTLRRPITNIDNFHNHNVIKVVIDNFEKALYFSRSAIPFHRDINNQIELLKAHSVYEHIGIYIYQHELLQRFSAMPSGTLEIIESLEQLRLMEAGIKIQTWETRRQSIRIDTHADLVNAENQNPELLKTTSNFLQQPTSPQESQ